MLTPRGGLGGGVVVAFEGVGVDLHGDGGVGVSEAGAGGEFPLPWALGREVAHSARAATPGTAGVQAHERAWFPARPHGIGKEIDVADEAWAVHRGFGGPPAAKGTVHLVGAGPGDVGLLTLRAATLLSTCDVVAYDRLAPAAALDLVPEHAQRICVGKRSGEAGTSGAAVDELLRSRALAGQAVVRLKGR